MRYFILSIFILITSCGLNDDKKSQNVKEKESHLYLDYQFNQKNKYKALNSSHNNSFASILSNSPSSYVLIYSVNGSKNNVINLETIIDFKPTDLIINDSFIEIYGVEYKKGDSRCCPSIQNKHRISI